MEGDDPLAVLITGDYDLWALAANNYKSNKLIDVLSQNIMRRQTYNGNWFSPGQRLPLECYAFSVIALAVKNMQEYMPSVLHDEVQERISKARDWMMKTKLLRMKKKHISY